MNHQDYGRIGVNQGCEKAVSLNPQKPEAHVDALIMHSKHWRAQLDTVLQDIKQHTQNFPGPNSAQASAGKIVLPICRNSDERLKAIEKIKEAIMWLGLDCRELNDVRSCYEHGYDASNAQVDPVPDGIKF